MRHTRAVQKTPSWPSAWTLRIDREWDGSPVPAAEQAQIQLFQLKTDISLHLDAP